jgi:hypothetical protein
MHHRKHAGAAWREARWLPRLVCRCRDLPDILKFARVAARSVAPAVCLYGAGHSSPSGAARESDVGVDMGLVSFDPAMMEAEFAFEACADLSLACAADVSGESGLARAGPGASAESIMQVCRDQQMVPFPGDSSGDGARPGSLLAALLRDPAPLARVQTVSPGGRVAWLPLYGEPERLAALCAGTAEAGIISWLELRLQPAASARIPARPSTRRSVGGAWR